MDKNYDFTGAAKRADLHLRTAFPHLDTTIYELEDGSCLIYCVDVNFEDYKSHFEQYIQVVGFKIYMTNKIPFKYVKILPKIIDSEISKSFEGMTMSKPEFFYLLTLKFPKVNFIKLDYKHEELKIYIASYKEEINGITNFVFLNNTVKKELYDFINGLKLPVPVRLIEENYDKFPEFNDEHIKNDRQTFYISQFKSEKQEFYTRDKDLWLGNVDRIFSGEFKKTDLFFFDPNEYSCYLDYSVFPNINLRNHLFLYQTVYISPPIDINILDWLRAIKVTKNEFLDLISRRRIKLLLIHSSKRYDLSFINEVFLTNPNSIITKDAISALLQIDLVEISDNYILNDFASLKELGMISELMGEYYKINPKIFYEVAIWPVKARRASFETLHRGGLVQMGSFGINTLFGKGYPSEKDSTLEYAMTSSPIHLANSLNATYFPVIAEDGFTDYNFAASMGELLNFYKCANKNDFNPFLENVKNIKSGVLDLNPIDIIEVNNYISIAEMDDFLNLNVNFAGNQRLLESLSSLDENERTKKIQYYNNEVVKKINNGQNVKTAFNLGKNVLMDIGGIATGFAFLGSVVTVAEVGASKLLKRLPLAKIIMSKINEALHMDADKANIHYLTKINRVARVKLKG